MINTIPTGMIEIHLHHKGGREWNTVEGWSGNDLITISEYGWMAYGGLLDVNKEKNLITVGPYRLTVLEWRDDRGEILAIRQRGIKTYFWVIGYKLKKIWLQVYHRLILTAWVWGLAERTPGAIPNWRDLKVVKRFIK